LSGQQSAAAEPAKPRRDGRILLASPPAGERMPTGTVRSVKPVAEAADDEEPKDEEMEEDEEPPFDEDTGEEGEEEEDVEEEEEEEEDGDLEEDEEDEQEEEGKRRTKMMSPTWNPTRRRGGKPGGGPEGDGRPKARDPQAFAAVGQTFLSASELSSTRADKNVCPTEHSATSSWKAAGSFCRPP